MGRMTLNEQFEMGGRMGREEIWPRVRARIGEWFTINDIKGGDRMNSRTVLSFLMSLVAAGHMERREREDDAHEYRLLKDLGHHVPRFNSKGQPVTQGAGVDNMWRTMRIEKEFDANDIANLSTTEGVNVEVATAQKYLSYLFRAGYLKVIEKANAHRRTRYRLIRDTGPLAPKIQSAKRVWDQNLGQAMAEVTR